MLEELALHRGIELADLEEIKAAFPGSSLDNRLRGLAECKIFLDGPEIAILKARWLGDWTAVILNIDYPSSFLWEVFDKMFLELGARSIYLSSSSRSSGDRFRAEYLGQ